MGTGQPSAPMACRVHGAALLPEVSCTSRSSDAASSMSYQRGNSTRSRPSAAARSRVCAATVSVLQAMSSWPEMTVDDGVRREEILRLIVQVSVGPVFDVRQKRTSGHAIAAQAVRDEASWLVLQPVQ